MLSCRPLCYVMLWYVVSSRITKDNSTWIITFSIKFLGIGAFLIPYFVSLFCLGIPLFFLELAIGQSLRQGSIGVWNTIHPYLGGVGYACVVVCLLVGMYYNMIIAWCFYYLFASFQDPLPYSSCSMQDNVTVLEECKLAGRTQYYWYRNALDVSPSLEVSGGLEWHLCLVLLLAWIVVFLCMMRDVQSAGKVLCGATLLSFKMMTSQKWFLWNYGFYSIAWNNLPEKHSHANKLALVSALNSQDMGFWSSNCFILNSLI